MTQHGSRVEGTTSVEGTTVGTAWLDKWGSLIAHKTTKENILKCTVYAIIHV